MWQFVEKIQDYYFWKMDSADHKGNPAIIYNVTKNNNPPKSESGYYSYGYLLKVKGLIKGITLNSIFNNL